MYELFAFNLDNFTFFVASVANIRYGRVAQESWKKTEFWEFGKGGGGGPLFPKINVKIMAKF